MLNWVPFTPARGAGTTLTLKVCYFGTYERDYPRNSQVISCLRGANVEVMEEHVPVWENDRHGWGAGPTRALQLAAAVFLHLAIQRDHLSRLEFVPQIRGVEPDALEPRSALASRHLKNWHSPGAEQP